MYLQAYVDIVLESLGFCKKEKGLKIDGWVVMSNHVHLVISGDQGNLSDIIKGFKKFNASQLYKAIEANERENRKTWLLWLLRKEDRIWFGERVIMEKKSPHLRLLIRRSSIFIKIS